MNLSLPRRRAETIRLYYLSEYVHILLSFAIFETNFFKHFLLIPLDTCKRLFSWEKKYFKCYRRHAWDFQSHWDPMWPARQGTFTRFFVCLKLKITKIAGSKGFYYSGKRCNNLEVISVFFFWPSPPSTRVLGWSHY